MPSRKELYDSISTNMRLDKNFFLKVYGYEITYPGFADSIVKRLEDLGCSKARKYYTDIVTEFEHKHDQEMKEVAEWYAKRYERSSGEWKRQEAERQQMKLQRSTEKLQLLRKKKELLIQQQCLTEEDSDR